MKKMFDKYMHMHKIAFKNQKTEVKMSFSSVSNNHVFRPVTTISDVVKQKSPVEITDVKGIATKTRGFSSLIYQQNKQLGEVQKQFKDIWTDIKKYRHEIFSNSNSNFNYEIEDLELNLDKNIKNVDFQLTRLEEACQARKEPKNPITTKEVVVATSGVVASGGVGVAAGGMLAPTATAGKMFLLKASISTLAKLTPYLVGGGIGLAIGVIGTLGYFYFRTSENPPQADGEVRLDQIENQFNEMQEQLNEIQVVAQETLDTGVTAIINAEEGTEVLKHESRELKQEFRDTHVELRGNMEQSVIVIERLRRKNEARRNENAELRRELNIRDAELQRREQVIIQLQEQVRVMEDRLQSLT